MTGRTDIMSKGQSRFDGATASFLAAISELVYRQAWLDDISATIDGIERIAFVDEGPTQCAVLYFPDAVVVAFRGTEMNFEDILTDIRIRRQDLSPVGWKAAEAHRGFMTAYGIASRELELAVRDVTVPIYVTGHSLGGALAVLAGLYLREAYPLLRIPAIYTFGCPRVGDADFAAWENASGIHHWRIVNRADIVPMVPLLAMGYRHGGTMIYRDRVGTIRKSPPLPWMLFDQAMWLMNGMLNPVNWRTWRPIKLFTDHRAAEYKRAFD